MGSVSATMVKAAVTGLCDLLTPAGELSKSPSVPYFHAQSLHAPNDGTSCMGLQTVGVE